jgi:hypothetical protein
MGYASEVDLLAGDAVGAAAGCASGVGMLAVEAGVSAGRGRFRRR